MSAFLTADAKNTILASILPSMEKVMIIEDPSNTFTINTLLSSASNIGYPSNVTINWLPISTVNSSVQTDNRATLGNSFNFSIFDTKVPKKLVFYKDGNTTPSGIIVLPTPVPNYANGGSYFIRQLSLDL